jgi:hypothetical protein
LIEFHQKVTIALLLAANFANRKGGNNLSPPFEVLLFIVS